MSISITENEVKDVNIKYENRLEAMDFRISNYIIDPEVSYIIVDVDIYGLIIHNILVEKNFEHYSINLPRGEHSPWSTSIPVISFYNNESWTALRYGIIREIKRQPWAMQFLDQPKD